MLRAALDIAALRRSAGGRWPRIDVRDEVGSTNAELAADADAPDRSVLVAEHQSAGRGRLDRSWTSPRGAGLTFSMLFRPGSPRPTWGWLPLLVGLALQDAVRGTGVDTVVKWPNDLLAADGEQKLAGVLAQADGGAVVVGVGLNVSTTADELPVATGTSLALCGATSTDRTALLAAILDRTAERLDRWTASGGDAQACGLRDDYRAACVTLGREVTVSTTAGPTVVGRAVDLTADGRLVVATPDGGRAEIAAGDVEHVRPAR